jgi:ADP-heptose:LPS heptosyltransferase
VLHPGAGSARRRWPPERFARVGDVLAERGLRVIVSGTRAEAGIVSAVRSAMRARSQDACGTLSLGGLAALLAAAALVVSNDSGPLHLANAVGARTVGIFWVGNMINAAPFGRARHRPVPTFRIRCPICAMTNVSETCGHDVSFLEDVPTDAVLEAALDLLADAERDRRAAA